MTKEIERQAICIENDIDKVFQSVHHVTFILCYTVLYNFLGLVFALIRVRKRWWDDITVIKFLKTGEISIEIWR